VVPLVSNDLHQIKKHVKYTPVNAMAKKLKKERKAKKTPPHQATTPPRAEADDSKNDFGGMDLRNFKKNLGCG
jgi:hypothetical protein